MAMKLKDKVALVTGASSGIGSATARALAGEGARVIVTARRIDRLRAMERESDGRIHAIEADLMSEASMDALMRDALAWSGGKLDILVNNAGLSRGNVLQKSELADLRVMIETNVFALANLTRLALTAIKAAKGTIINIASTAAKSAPPGSTVYAATKAAVGVFSEALRKEVFTDGVRVTTIYPGFVETEFFDGMVPEKRDSLKQMLAAVEPLKSEDLADLIAYIVTRPAYVSLNEVVIRPTKQP